MNDTSQVQTLLNYRQLGRHGIDRDIFGLDSWTKRLCLTKKLEKHQGCVNAICWNDDGSLLIGGSDDQHLSIWSGHTFQLLDYIPTFHSNNIFCAKFVPGSGDSKIISTAADGEVHYLDLGHPASKPNNANSQSSYRGTCPISQHFNNIAMKFEFLPNCPSAFLTTHQDGTVCLIDTRTIQQDSVVSEEIVVHLRNHLSCYSLCFDPLQPNTFAVSASDNLVRLYDIRVPSRPFSHSCDAGYCLQKICHPELFKRKPHNQQLVTDVQINSKGELLVNYSSYDLVLFDIHQSNWSTENKDENVCTKVIQQYKGRSNCKTFLKEARFYGSEKYIITGSDSGEVFIWNKLTAELIRKMPADQFVVNGIAPHPTLPTLATCGIDSDIKIFEVNVGIDPDNSIEVADEPKSLLSKKASLNLSFRYRAREHRQDILTVQQNQKRIESAKNSYKLALELYNQEKFVAASHEWNISLKWLTYYPPGLTQRREQCNWKKKILIKLIHCYNHLEKWRKVVSCCTSLLELDNNNLEALFLRSRANLNLDDLFAASKDASRIALVYPDFSGLSELIQNINLQANISSSDSDKNEPYSDETSVSDSTDDGDNSDLDNDNDDDDDVYENENSWGF